MQLDIVNSQNEKVGAVEVRDEVFGGRVNTDLIWESADVLASVAMVPTKETTSVF